ncbi:MAG: hypothetical protein Q4F52_10215, partial [Bacteroidaceae bacterium]|nr:hypothetical protein [Bacteroidaceae bacterium]
MKTKHLFMSLALAGVFVGCADEEFVSNNQSMQMEERPVVGSVSLKLANEEVDSRLINADGVDWTGMTIGAALMDELTNSSAVGLAKYTLTEKLWTNYPYTRTASGYWDNDALMVEGNYFYYAPYDAGLGRGELKHTINSIQYVYDNVANANLGMTTEAEYIAYNPADKNQLYVGYHGFVAGKEKEAIKLNMAPAHAELQLSFFNASTSDITVHKVVVYKKNSANFSLVSNLNPTTNVNYTYNTLVDGVVTSQIASLKLNGRFDKLGEEIPYTDAKNPVKGAMDYAGTTPSVTVVFPNLKVAKNSGFDAPARIVLPQGGNYSTDNLMVDIYTSKGVMTQELKATHTGESAAAIRAQLSMVQGSVVSSVVGLVKQNYNAETEKYEGDWFVVNGKFTALGTIDVNRAMIAYNDAYVFTVPADLTVSNTDELEYYLKNWYAGRNSGATPMTSLNVKVANDNGIAINKAIYDYMCGATNPVINVNSGALIIPNDETIPADAVMKLSTTAPAKVVIAEGEEQTVSYPTGTAVQHNFITVVENNGILNVETTDATDKVRFGGYGIVNNGTFNVKTPVIYGANSSVFVNNGVLNLSSTFEVTSLTNGSTTNQTAEINVTANNTAITTLTNYGKLNVNANLTSTLNNKTVGTLVGTTTVYTDAEVNVAAGKALTVGGYNEGIIESEGTIVVNGAFENKVTGTHLATIKNETATSILRTANPATLTNNGLIENSGMIGGASGANIDNNKNMTLKEGSLTLMTNNNVGGEITCEVINNDLQIEGANDGFVTYTMANASEDLSTRNVHINKLNVTCSGNIDLTSIFVAAEQTASIQTVAKSWTKIQNIAISSTTASTFTFAEGTLLNSLSISGGVDHTIKSVSNDKI